MMQTGMTRSSSQRLENAFRAGGQTSDNSLASMLGGLGGSGGIGQSLSKMLGGGSGGGLGGLLGSVLSQAGNAMGGKQNLAIGSLGALAGSLFGGGRSPVKGGLGGGIMALLGAMAFSAFKKAGSRKPSVPLGLREPASSNEEKELEHEAELVFKAMINAAKADNRIDREELGRIMGKLEELGVGNEEKEYVMAELKKPMETAAIVNAVSGRPELGAQLYAASLLAIEVDTPVERDYMQGLRSQLGLPQEVTEHLEEAVGLGS
jgi:uncharacterized membrane protein YebE (DUF533 family)